MKVGYHLSRELLSTYLDDMLPKGRKQKVKEHLDSCTECREIYRGLEAVRQLLGKYPLKDPGVGFRTAILNRIEAEKKSVALRTWSRRASLSLGGLALLLITFLFLYKLYLPVPTIEPEKAVTQPRPVKVEEEKTPIAEKPAVPERRYSAAKEKEKKQLPGPTVGASLGPIPELPAAPNREAGPRGIVRDEAASSLMAPVSAEKEEQTPIVESSKLGRTPVFLREKAVPAPSAIAVAKPAVVPALPPQNTIIRTGEEWTRTWSTQNTAQNLSLPLPQVDFKSQMVIAVPTRQDNREYRIVKTEDKEDKIVVQYREIIAGKDEEKPIPPYQLEVVNSRPSVEFQKVN